MKAGTLASFLAVDLLLVAAPGADWAYVIASGLREHSLLPAVGGLVAGYAGHTLLVVAGLAVLVATTPGVLTALTVRRRIPHLARHDHSQACRRTQR